MTVIEERNHTANGRGRRYFRNGAMAYDGTYKGGERDGFFDYWNSEGTWQKQEFYRQGKLVWTSLEEFEYPPKTITGKPAKANSSPLFTKGKETPSFTGMRPLVLRDGAMVQVSHQQVFRDGNISRAYNLVVSAAHDLAAVAMPNVVAYGGLGVTTVGFGSVEAEELWGKRNLELGARWRSAKRDLALSFGASIPVGGDSADGYRADDAGGQLGMDGTIGAYPRTSGVRTHAARVFQLGRLWLRADAGLDLVLDTHGDDDLRVGAGALPLARAGASAGIATQRFFFSSQVRAVRSLRTEATQANASVAVQIHQYAFRPGLTVYLPLAGEQKHPGAALSITYDLD